MLHSLLPLHTLCHKCLELCAEIHGIMFYNALGHEEHFKTLFHEFTHVVQDIFGIKDEEIRESQAYQIEGTMYREMCAT